MSYKTAKTHMTGLYPCFCIGGKHFLCGIGDEELITSETIDFNELTLTTLNKFAADDILTLMFVNFSEKLRLDVSCETSAQTFHIKC